MKSARPRPGFQGVFSRDGEFLPFPVPDPAAVMEVFRRLFLERLHQADG